METNEGIQGKDKLNIRNQPEASGNEISADLEHIDNTITARYIHGKFQGPVVLHGQQVADDNYNKGKGGDYHWLPELTGRELRSNLDPSGQFTALNKIIRQTMSAYSNRTELQRTLANSHVLGYLTDKSKPNESTLYLIYPYEFDDIFARSALTAEVAFKLPTESLKQLLGIITENPDSLEQFYQIATAGLDSSVKRYMSSQLAIVNLDTFMPLDKFPTPDNNPESLGQMVVFGYPNRLNPQGLTLLQYTSPYGSVDKASVETEHAKQIQRREEELSKQSPQTPRVETSQPKITPAPMDNPSGLYPDAPLTKLINAGIRLFRPKGK